MALDLCATEEEPARKARERLSGRDDHRGRQVRRRRMTRVALDSNILIYAELEPDSGKGKRAANLILRAAQDGVIPVQVLGEWVRFVQRRVPDAFAEAIRQASIYQAACVTPPTMDTIISK